MENNNIIMVAGERTILTKANNKSYSLRTTVPKGITSHLDLKEGDSLLWKLTPSKNRKELLITVETQRNKEEGK